MRRRANATEAALGAARREHEAQLAGGAEAARGALKASVWSQEAKLRKEARQRAAPLPPLLL